MLFCLCITYWFTVSKINEIILRLNKAKGVSICILEMGHRLSPTTYLNFSPFYL